MDGSDAGYTQPVIDDRQIWAVALRVEQDHGADAPRQVAERIGALALTGDMRGIGMWKRVAAKLDCIRQGIQQ